VKSKRPTSDVRLRRRVSAIRNSVLRIDKGMETRQPRAKADHPTREGLVGKQKADARRPVFPAVTAGSDAESNRALDLFSVDRGETTEYDFGRTLRIFSLGRSTYLIEKYAISKALCSDCGAGPSGSGGLRLPYRAEASVSSAACEGALTQADCPSCSSSDNGGSKFSGSG
jgi:hypothetical protein